MLRIARPTRLWAQTPKYTYALRHLSSAAREHKNGTVSLRPLIHTNILIR